MPAKIKHFPSHFWSRFKRAKNGCLEWQGCRWDNYGETGFEGRVRKTHVVAWILSRGAVPKGKCILHSCDNPPCGEPSHLFAGTKKDNNKDREMKGRGRYAAGEACSWSKLKWKDVSTIRDLYRTKKKNMYDLAKTYSVDPRLIWAIIHRKIWKVRHRGYHSRIEKLPKRCR
jgi:hypothetical protein